MERRYTGETLPLPNDDRIRIVERPPRIMAVRRFSGAWSEGNVVRNESALLDGLASGGLTPISAAVLARYDAPFMPWFLRRNELMVEIAADSPAI